MSKLTDQIIDFHGWLSDKDFIWWPFSFLRPEKTEEISFKHVLLMSLCFGGGSSVMLAVIAVMNNAFKFENQIQTSLLLLSLFFIWFTIVTRPLWNARARRLRK